ncbi:MAG: hypothetical protein AB2822_01985 [Candidatus Thiodiazotropha endolucinida]
MALLIGVILMWGMFIGYQSSVGRFSSEPFYNLIPGYWMPYVPVVVAVSMMLLLAPLRDGLRILVDKTPAHWLSGIHILRILALGTLLKASNDLFPQMFAWFVGGPDLLFGVSAIIVTLLARSGRLSDRFILFWHLVGAFAIVLPVAGLMHLFMAEALFAELFMFPMVMAPALIVPTLVLLNLLVAWRFYEQGALHR